MMTLANLASHAPSAYDLLYRIGLERRRSRAVRAASRAGWLGVGMAVGGGLALLLAPRAGSEIREALGEKAKRARSYMAPHDEDESESRNRASAQRAATSRV